ncbi:MAG: hypothetical protein P4L51_26230 [Puia sp.]|nr:hypothetical protein [Puia sp.]
MAAFSNHEIIGGLTAYELPIYDADTAELYIYDIAVSCDIASGASFNER